METDKEHMIKKTTDQIRHGFLRDWDIIDIREVAKELIVYCDYMDSIPVERCSKCGKVIR